MQPWKTLTKPVNIEVVSPEGEVRSRLVAHISGNVVYIDDMSVDVRAGDEIRRVLPNGNEEAFLVTDPTYIDSNHFGKHYQVKVSRRGNFPAHTGGNYNITVSGQNSRVTIGSTDSSTNTISITTFNDLRAALKEGVTDQEKLAELNARLDELESAKTQPTFLTAYQKFFATAADYMTLLAPFIPTLATIIPSLPLS
jgi:hypothetical protein